MGAGELLPDLMAQGLWVAFIATHAHRRPDWAVDSSPKSRSFEEEGLIHAIQEARHHLQGEKRISQLAHRFPMNIVGRPVAIAHLQPQKLLTGQALRQGTDAQSIPNDDETPIAIVFRSSEVGAKLRAFQDRHRCFLVESRERPTGSLCIFRTNYPIRQAARRKKEGGIRHVYINLPIRLSHRCAGCPSRC